MRDYAPRRRTLRFCVTNSTDTVVEFTLGAVLSGVAEGLQTDPESEVELTRQWLRSARGALSRTHAQTAKDNLRRHVGKGYRITVTIVR